MSVSATRTGKLNSGSGRGVKFIKYTDVDMIVVEARAKIVAPVDE